MRRKWVLGLLILFSLLFFSIPRLYLLPNLTEKFALELEQALHPEEIEIEIRAPWGWEPIFGRIPQFTVLLKDATVGGLQLNEINFSGSQVRFDRRALWQEKIFSYQGAEHLTAIVDVTEDDLNQLFWREIDPSQNLSLEIEERGLNLVGRLELWNTEWSVKLRGRLEIGDGNSLYFVPENFSLADQEIPRVLLNLLTENYDFVLNLSDFPFPLEIKEIIFLEKKLQVKMGGS